MVMGTASGVAGYVGEVTGNPFLMTVGQLGQATELAEMGCGRKIQIRAMRGGKPVGVVLERIPNARFPHPQNWKIPAGPWVEKISQMGGGGRPRPFR
jgi:hypothetical protein